MRIALKDIQRGTSLLEVLITLVITSVGLLGLAGLQSKLQVSEVESYQRSQAIILLNDMVSRIQSNHRAAATYVTGAPLGVGAVCPTTAISSTRQEVDAAQWCVALQGAAERMGGANAGAMIGGRGCVESLPNNQYLVTVVWQGQSSLGAPPSSVACGVNLYDTAGSSCAQDSCRRAITSVVHIATLN
jgi:type IV pilus assembly protein PilV